MGELIERTMSYRARNQFETLLAEMPQTDERPDYTPPERTPRLTIDDVIPDEE